MRHRQNTRANREFVECEKIPLPEISLQLWLQSVPPHTFVQVASPSPVAILNLDVNRGAAYEI